MSSAWNRSATFSQGVPWCREPSSLRQKGARAPEQAPSCRCRHLQRPRTRPRRLRNNLNSPALALELECCLHCTGTGSCSCLRLALHAARPGLIYCTVHEQQFTRLLDLNRQCGFFAFVSTSDFGVPPRKINSAGIIFWSMPSPTVNISVADAGAQGAVERSRSNGPRARQLLRRQARKGARERQWELRSDKISKKFAWMKGRGKGGGHE